MKNQLQKSSLAVLLGFAGRMAANILCRVHTTYQEHTQQLVQPLNALNIYGVLGRWLLTFRRGYTKP